MFSYEPLSRTGVEKQNLQRAQSSPGKRHEGHEPSKWIWQMPHTSSSGMSHRHVATAAHFLILTFMAGSRQGSVEVSVYEGRVWFR